MQLAQVVGRAVSTVKHKSLEGWRLLVVQPLGPGGALDGEPLLAIDKLGGGRPPGDDFERRGRGPETVNARNSPVRWMVLGVCD